MAPTPPTPLLEEGSRLGQYQIVRKAGAGGMGVVYLARDVDLERDVGLKVLRPAGAASEETDGSAVERLLREARSAARLNHPNTVAVYQVGRHEGLTFIAMEWVDGGSLSEHLRHSIFLDWREATAAVRDAAAGLAAAHRAGIIHRDLKPANLMRTTGGLVKVVDFGLARVQDVPSELTASGIVLGTPSYLAPEQCRGEAATIASDIYALTCTYFHLLTSRPPFDAPGILELLQKHLHEPFPDARRFADEIPDAVATILSRGSRKDPAARYASCSAMLADLEAALAGRAVAAGAPAAETTIALPETPPPAPVTPNNLPHATNRFVGRRREMDDARRLLGGNRLVSLIGPGGTGKTRLSLELGAAMLGEYPDGVWFADLAPLATGDLLPQTVASAVGVKAAPGRTPTQALIDHVAKKGVLIILDNCEQVLSEAASAAAALLGACPGLRMLATSRQALGCAGEVEMRIPPLAAPASGELPPLGELASLDAVKLFVDRAAHARPGFALAADNAAAVAAVCRQLDGIPLAIELAAARVKVLSAAQIADRLGDAFKLLTTGPRTALPRQRTLRALIDWSYDLLSEEERVVFARLSVFAGSFALESAEEVVGGGAVDSAAVLDLIAELSDKSLLLVEDRDGVVRYRMLVTIRQYAAAKLDDAGERAAVGRAHLAHFTALAEAALPKLYGPEQAAWLARLDAEHDNLRAALDRAADTALSTRLAAALVRYWVMRGHVVEGLAYLEKLVSTAAPGASSPALARVLDGAGLLMIYQGNRARAQDYLERSLAMARAVGDRGAEAAALNDLGTLSKEIGDLAGAHDLFTQVMAIHRESGDALGLANVLNNLGTVLLERASNPAECRRQFEESLAIHQRLGNATWVAYTNLNLGELEYDCGNVDAARRRYAETLRILESLNDDWGVAYAIEGLGKCDLLSGDLAAAEERFERVIRMVRKHGDKRTIADQWDNLARTALRRGDISAALPLARQGLALCLELDDKLGLARLLETLAEAYRAADPERAAMLLGGADAIRNEIKAARYPIALAAHETLLELVKSALGDEAFTRAFESGRLLEPASVLAQEA